MEFRILKGSKSRTLYLAALNLGVTQAIIVLVFTLGDIHSSIDYVDLVFEAASGCFAFLLFLAVAQVTVPGARINWLLVGLFLFQTGALIDVLDEVVTFGFSMWSVAGDALRLAGELTLAVVALLFVRLTTTIASTDRLTNLYNKAFHNRWIDEYLERSSSRLAVIAIDLDKFKNINDLHGHAFGDTVLQHVSQLLAEFMQSHRGIASRTGGEEFEVTLKRATEESALQAAEQIRALIANNPPQDVPITASIGVALSQDDEATANLRKRADAAAYYSKQSGRNRVTLAGNNQTLTGIDPT